MYGLIIVFWLIVGPLGGFAIGNPKGHGAVGIASGLALGPLFGWLLVGLMEPSPGVLETRRRALAYHLANPPATNPLAPTAPTGLAAPSQIDHTAADWVPAEWVESTQTAELKDALGSAGVSRRDVRRIVDAFWFVKNGSELLPQLIEATNAGGEPTAIAERVRQLIDQAPKNKL